MKATVSPGLALFLAESYMKLANLKAELGDTRGQEEAREKSMKFARVAEILMDEMERV